VIRYAQQAASLLVNGGIKLLVVACNTASAVGLEALRKHFAHLPVIGVVEPGAQASCAVSRNGRIAVIGTEGTILGGAYQRAITDIRPDALVVAQPCSLFVALAEEGWIEGELVEAIISKYLTPILRREASDPIDCMVLGCTHFPALSGAIQNVVGQTVKLVDSAETTAKAVKRELNRLGLLAPADASDAALTRFLVTDGPDRFSRVAPHFFHSPVPLSLIELVDIGTTA
jgi:glutamate racemase